MFALSALVFLIVLFPSPSLGFLRSIAVNSTCSKATQENSASNEGY